MAHSDRLKVKAHRLRKQGWQFRHIGVVLGVPRSTVEGWINDPHGSRTRARKDSYRRPCPICGTLMSGCNGHGKRAPKLCTRCSRKHERSRSARMAAARAEVLCAMWAQGMTRTEIAKVLGIKPKSASVKICALRAKGFDLPHRRTAEQRARMGNPTTMARARRARLAA